MVTLDMGVRLSFFNKFKDWCKENDASITYSQNMGDCMHINVSTTDPDKLIDTINLWEIQRTEDKIKKRKEFFNRLFFWKQSKTK